MELGTPSPSESPIVVVVVGGVVVVAVEGIVDVVVELVLGVVESPLTGIVLTEVEVTVVTDVVVVESPPAIGAALAVGNATVSNVATSSAIAMLILAAAPNLVNLLQCGTNFCS